MGSRKKTRAIPKGEKTLERFRLASSPPPGLKELELKVTLQSQGLGTGHLEQGGGKGSPWIFIAPGPFMICQGAKPQLDDLKAKNMDPGLPQRATNTQKPAAHAPKKRGEAANQTRGDSRPLCFRVYFCFPFFKRPSVCLLHLRVLAIVATTEQSMTYIYICI